MVLREIDEADSNPLPNDSSSSSSDPASPTYNPDTDTFNEPGHVETPKVVLPDGRSLPIWTVPAVKHLIEAHPRYPNPFTPIPFYAKLLGWTELFRDASILANVNRTQLYIARPLTPIEVEAETYYHSILYQYMYKSECIGILSFLALAAFRQNAAKTRPGLITPHAKKYMGDVAGDWYITITRYGIYGFFGRLQGQIIGALIGGNRMKEMTKNDPNVQELRRDLAEFRNWTESEIHRKLQRRREGSKESVFPTVEELMKHSMEHRRYQVGEGEVRGEGPLERSAVDHSQSDTVKLSQWSTKGPYPPPPPSPIRDPLEDIISPSDSGSSSASSSGGTNPGESTWDRIRRERIQAQKSNNLNSTSESRSSLKSDSFTFSEGDRERQEAQAEAQKDFDARVERERSGQRGWGSR